MVLPLLRADGITVSRRDLERDAPGRVLVDDVSLTIASGERVALLGRSGSGKSLFAAALTATVPPALSVGGAVHVAGTVVTGAELGRRDVVLVRQDSSDALNPLVRIKKQMEIPLRGTGAGKDEARRLLVSVGLEDPDRILRSFPPELSGGQRQRVCIALSLACKAKLLIADESTTALDVISQAEVVRALQEVESLLFITHDLVVAAQLCDRAVVMDHGRVIEDGPVSRLFDDPQHPVTRSLVEQARHRAGWAA